MGLAEGCAAVEMMTIRGKGWAGDEFPPAPGHAAMVQVFR